MMRVSHELMELTLDSTKNYSFSKSNMVQTICKHICFVHSCGFKIAVQKYSPRDIQGEYRQRLWSLSHHCAISNERVS